MESTSQSVSRSALPWTKLIPSLRFLHSGLESNSRSHFPEPSDTGTELDTGSPDGVRKESGITCGLRVDVVLFLVS